MRATDASKNASKIGSRSRFNPLISPKNPSSTAIERKRRGRRRPPGSPARDDRTTWPILFGTRNRPNAISEPDQRACRVWLERYVWRRAYLVRGAPFSPRPIAHGRDASRGVDEKRN